MIPSECSGAGFKADAGVGKSVSASGLNFKYDYSVPLRLVKKITTREPYGCGIFCGLFELKTGAIVIHMYASGNWATCDMITGNVCWQAYFLIKKEEFQKDVDFGGRFKSTCSAFILGDSSYVVKDTSNRLPDWNLGFKNVPDGRMLSNGVHFVASNRLGISVYDCSKGQFVCGFEIQHSCIEPLFEGRLAVGCEDGFIRIFNEGKLESQWQAHSGKVETLKLLSNGKLVSASLNGSQIELATWECVMKCGQFYESREIFTQTTLSQRKDMPVLRPDPRADLL